MNGVENLMSSKSRVIYQLTDEQLQEFAQDNWGHSLSEDQLAEVEMALLGYDTDFIGGALHRVLDVDA